MIVIVNISKNLKPAGEHLYEIRINQEVICQFKHPREQDLARILLRAAVAVANLPERKRENHLRRVR